MDKTYACRSCGCELKPEDMPRHKYRRNGTLREYRVHKCVECHKARVNANNRRFYTRHHDAMLDKRKVKYTELKKDQRLFLLRQSGPRARSRGRQFTLTIGDIIIPEYCPILGLKLTPLGQNGKPIDSTPSLDRLDSSKGYIPGNVNVISHRANVIKNCGTVEEHQKVIAWMLAQSTK